MLRSAASDLYAELGSPLARLMHVEPRSDMESLMQDQNVVVTGGTDGIGKAAAVRLAKLGAGLLLISRNPDKGEAAVAEIKRVSGNDSVAYLQADLSMVKNVRGAARQIRATFDRLDVLVHCAGNIFPRQRTLTDDGLELSFAIQYMARFVLTNELLDLLRAAPAPQVLSVMGGGTISGRVDFDNLQGEKSYGFTQAIKTTSRAGDMLTFEQILRYPEITFYNYGPGLVRSGLIIKNPVMRLLMNTVGRPFSRSAEQAADDMLTLLTGKYASGFYVAMAKRNDAPKSADPASCERMWEHGKALADGLSIGVGRTSVGPASPRFRAE
jgi:NAD(P)-dependent dehydrogenase (short-subunit alcohol dehydrogenase family)